MKRAVIYARYSSDRQRAESIEDQIRVCSDFCGREGMELVGIYADYAISGRTDDRPEFLRMIKNAGESDFVVVFAMDRFSRDPYDAPIYKKQLKKRGVSVLSATERIDQTPDGIIMEKLLEGMAARESMVTAIRTKRGMEGNARKCLHNGVSIFGYAHGEDGRFEVDPHQAPFVVEAFERRLSREALHSIARDFALRGVTTYTGKPCNQTMVAHMMGNERYTGVYIWGDIRIDGGMPAIIDRDTWEAVQMVRGKKVHKEEQFGDYALSGKATCTKCGASIVGVSSKNHAGVRYEYYRCGKKCGLHNVRRDIAEQAIADALRDVLMGPDAYEVAAEVERGWRADADSTVMKDAAKRAENARKSRENIMRAVESGMPWEDVEARYRELGEIAMRAEADLIMHAHDAEFDTEDFVEFLRFGATLDDRTLLDAFVDHVAMMDDGALVVLAYEDENTHQPAELPVDWCVSRNSGSPNITVYAHTIAVFVPFAA